MQADVVFTGGRSLHRGRADAARRRRCTASPAVSSRALRAPASLRRRARPTGHAGGGYVGVIDERLDLAAVGRPRRRPARLGDPHGRPGRQDRSESDLPATDRTCAYPSARSTYDQLPAHDGRPRRRADAVRAQRRRHARSARRRSSNTSPPVCPWSAPSVPRRRRRFSELVVDLARRRRRRSPPPAEPALSEPPVRVASEHVQLRSDEHHWDHIAATMAARLERRPHAAATTTEAPREDRHRRRRLLRCRRRPRARRGRALQSTSSTPGRHVAGNCHTERDADNRRAGARLRPAHLPHPVRPRLGVRQPLRRVPARTSTA